MIQRDYILRMIEQFGQFVTALVNLREAGRLEESRAAVDQALLGLVGLDLRAALEQPTERMIGAVRFATRQYATTAPATQQLNLLGRLLREAAETLERQGDTDAAALARFRALDVHTTVLTVEDPASEEAARATDDLVEALRDYTVPLDIRWRLWQSCSTRGLHARAEDWLFDVLDDTGDNPELLASALGRYEALAALDDDALRAGGLSSDEVSATLLELRERLERAGDSEAG